VPASGADWDVGVRNARGLAATLAAEREQAALFKVLATLRTDCEVGTVDDWEWTGPRPELTALAERLGADDVVRRAEALAARRA
jgi:hypothetical protein